MKTLLYSVFQHDFRHTDSDIRPVLVRKLLEKPLGIFGPVFVFGFPEIEIIHLPGHTQGSIGVIFENNLFAGDLIMNMPIPSTSWFAEDFSELRRSRSP